jgi:tRNA(fMet)-specific endonuclease VapC
MTYLLDTDICIHWLRGQSAVHRRLAAVGPEAICVSTITLAELYYGAECSQKAAENHRAIDDFSSGVHVLGVNSDVARTFGEIKAQLRRQGGLIEDFDLALAATALAYGFILVTNNVSHFARIAGLIVENWVQP